MMQPLEFYLPGEPVSLKRPRFGKHGCVYDSQRQIKIASKLLIKSQFKGGLLTDPLAVDLVFKMTIPNSFSHAKKNRLNGAHHTKKPDVDNMMKFYLDVMNGVVFKDDSQITQLSARKIYSCAPGISITIYALHLASIP